MAAGTIRLSKVLKELNVGFPTVLEFLARKGLKIESNPNTKITEEIHELLLDEFQSEMKDKEQAKNITHNRVIRKEFIETGATLPASKKEKEEEEIMIKDTSAAKEEVIRAKPGELRVNLKGKIDLEAASPKKKKGTDSNRSEGEKTKTNFPKDDVEIPPVVEDKPKKEDFIETKYTKLEGPKILDKIELPAEEKKTPVASSNETFGKKKKKRKRVRKAKVSQDEWKNFNYDKFKQGGGVGKSSATGTGGRGGKRREPKVALTEEEVQTQIKETLAKLSASGGKSKTGKYRRAKREEMAQKREIEAQQQEENLGMLKVTEFVSASQLASMMNKPVNEIIQTCMSLGLFVSINQRLDAETITIVAEEFGFKVEFVAVEAQVSIQEEQDKPEDLKPRPPIVTVMGHVDHGKTSLLDYVRKTNVIAGEAGGITQHIGAYNVNLVNGKTITFLDTPGHEAFTAMRARGAQVTDVAIIVIAADDSVMPQTTEAINHAQAAGVPMVFAINKIDKPGANADKIREALSQMNILVEEWGGKFQCSEISAKKGTGIDALLDKVLLEADFKDLKANPNRKATGTIIESELDKGRGYVSTVLVKTGTLRMGDVILAGSYSGRVKALHNERGGVVEEAGPAMPVQILGLSGAPQAGDKFNVMEDERGAREIANRRLQLQREQTIRTTKHITLDEIGRRIAIGDFKELNVIVKGDVDGSIEALTDSLQKLSTEKISLKVIHKSVGAITESDVLLASASNAIIVGFQVRPTQGAKKLAEAEQIDIRLYSIIYKAIEEIKDAMEGMLAPELQEKIVCNIEIREVFNITKVGTVAGCMVLSGKVSRNTKVRIIREGIVVHSGELGSLKRFKDDAKEVAAGFECGLNITNFNDIKTGDIIEGYDTVEVKQKL